MNKEKSKPVILLAFANDDDSAKHLHNLPAELHQKSTTKSRPMRRGSSTKGW
jgi:hypothetical protein